MNLSRLKYNQFNIWPGFVDVLATLLIVTIFTIMISGVAQVYFNEVLGKKTSEISQLDLKLKSLSEELSLQINKNDTLNERNVTLESSIKNLKDENKVLDTSLKKSKLSLKLNDQKIFSLGKEKENLENNLRQTNKKIVINEKEINKKERIILQNLKSIVDLEKNINELKKQIFSLSAQLEESENRDLKNKVKIQNLGKKLNLALAGKVQELSEYQSIFLKKIKNVISGRKDIILSDDRFVFPAEIFFKSGNDSLEDTGLIELKKIASSLTEISKIIPKEIDWVLRIDGHTDKRPISTKKFSSNWQLSSARAIKIVKYLINEGIPPDRLVAAGFGEFHPLVDENNERAYSKNRRIEIKLTKR